MRLLVSTLILATTVSAWALTVTATTNLRFLRGFAGDGNAILAATAPTAGTITLLGGANRTITVTRPGSVTLSFGASTLTANNFTQSPATFTLNAAGTGTVSIGGRRLAIPGGAAAGTHVGTGVWSFTEQGTGNTTATPLAVEAPVWRPLALLKNNDLDFGLGAVGDGTKTVLPSAATAASIAVSGQPSATFTVTLPASVTMNCGGCGGTAAQRRLTATLALAPTSPVALDAAGNVQLRIGGTRQAITVGKRQGLYTASFTVTVAYN